MTDVGCGPSQWTKFLADQGAAVEGIDVVPSFIEQAKARFPGIPFRVASLNSLGVPKAYASGEPTPATGRMRQSARAWQQARHAPTRTEKSSCLRPCINSPHE